MFLTRYQLQKSSGKPFLRICIIQIIYFIYFKIILICTFLNITTWGLIKILGLALVIKVFNVV